MDCEKLINQIALNPPLWNRKCEGYCNRFVTDKIWAEISINLKTSKDKCRKKWKYLKDEYRKALRRVPQEVSEPHISRFKYFESMAFLNDGINSHGDPLLFERSFETFSVDESTTMSLISNADTADNKNFEKVPESYPLPTNEQRRKKRTRIDELNDTYLENENKVLKLLEKNIEKDKEDVDLYFFKSLLPFVKDIPLLEKLKMRGQIQAVVLKYCEKMNRYQKSH